MEMTIRTRANAAPYGKPRVALLCHSDDIELWANDTASLILRHQDCAVAFGGELEAPLPEELAGMLASYQLIVVLGTRRLLAESNPIRDGVVAAAADVHVPVLPIMMEPGLDELYAESPFTSLQYLDPTLADPTALPFEHKLAVHLKKTLVGAELAEQIRNAFDGYLFLSYRKKDRAYAQELMRLIHRNPLCRDLAIWYDEYLELGEDFNDSIRTALEKSAVCVLVVTPNILERPNGKPNYVMAEEYPAAKASGKPVEPVEMLHVDGEQLARFFAGIGVTVNPTDEQQMEAFSIRVGEESGATADKPLDPAHDYLIGVAYLDGVDVETDAARAVELIEKAGEAGHVEALKHLAMMYRTGKGVPRDYETAAQYGERVLEALIAAYEAAPGNPAVADDVQDQAESLAEMYLELSRPGDAVDALRRALHALTGATGGAGDNTTGDTDETCGAASARNSAPAMLLALLAYAEYRAGSYAEARDHAARAVQQSADETSEYRDAVLLKALDVLGDAEDRLGDENAALESRERFLERLRAVEATRGEPEMRLSTAIGLGKLAESCTAAKLYDRARLLATEAVGKLQALLLEFGIAFCGRNLVNALCKLGDAENAQGLVDEAAKHYDQAVDTARQVVADMSTMGSRRNLSLALHRSAFVRNAAGDLPQAAVLLDEAVAIRRELRDAGGQPSDAAYLGKYLVLAASIALQRNDAAAVALASEGVSALDAYLATADVPDARRDRAMCAHYLGLACRRWGTMQDAVRGFTIAVQDNQVLVERFGQILDVENLCAELLALGDALQDGGSIDAAGTPYSHACDIAQRLAEQTGQSKHAETSFAALSKMGKNRFLCGDYDAAGQCLSDALGLAQEILVTNDSPNLRYSVIEDYGVLAQVLQEVGPMDYAHEISDMAITHAENLAAQTQTSSAIELFVRIAEQTGDFERRQGQAHAARAAYIKAAPYAEALARQLGDERYWAGYISMLVKASWVPADEFEAGELLHMALRVCGEFAEACPGSAVAQTMAADIRSRLAAETGGSL